MDGPGRAGRQKKGPAHRLTSRVPAANVSGVRRSLVILAIAAALGGRARAQTAPPGRDAGAPPDGAAGEATGLLRQLMPPSAWEALLDEVDGDLSPFYADLVGRARTKRAELEAKADAEKARPRPDRKKLARLRRATARLQLEEARWTRAIAEERRLADEERARRPSLFQNVKAVDQEQLDGIFH
jgi:hypothetical protein